MKTSIQPYELLGVTMKSSLNDVRKAYYQLALLCHPDKGGNPQDMQLLHSAYKL
jgi:curved DNA-binding protein CbpA